MLDYRTLAILLSFQAPAICLVLCLYVFITLPRSGATRTQFIQLRCMAAGCIAYMLAEVLNGLILYGIVSWDIEYTIDFNNLCYAILLFNSVVMGEYCLTSVKNISGRTTRLVRGIYVLSGVFLLVRLFFRNTELFVYLNNQGEVCYGLLDSLNVWGCALIDGILSFILLGRVTDKNDYVNRERNSKLLFATAVLTCILVLFAFLHIPYIIWMSNMLVLLILHFGLQSLMINHDELTKLSNRRCMLKDIEEIRKTGNAWGYILFDLNLFKKINDEYGHNEGDRALTAVASVLESVSLKNNAKAYRIGGDEFAIVVQSDEKAEFDMLCEEINQTLASCSKQEKIPYAITLSSGYAICKKDSPAEVPNIMATADRNMYIHKKGAKNQFRE